MRKIIISILTITILSQFGFSQSLDTNKLDSFFNALEVNNRYMGSVAISKGGEIVYTKQIGFLDIENNLKANRNTVYRIGSISKMFTSVLVFKAVEENKIKLTDKIDKFFPLIKNAKLISIGNLLNHRSGIHNFTNNDDYLSYNTQKKSEKELLEIFNKMNSDFEPGTKADYSNTNYVLLSFILQKIYNKDYATLLKEKITNPLGLKYTYFGKPINIKDNESNSYTFKTKWIKETETDMSIPLGAGGIVSTPSDLTKFADALFNGKLVTRESLEKMKTIENNYGMGLFEFPFYKREGFGHTGGIDGYSSTLSHFKDGDISIAITSNGSNFNNNDIAIALLSAVYNLPFTIPEFKSISLTTEDLDKYLGVYSSKEMPIKITISKDGISLIGQATGQGSFVLEAVDKNIFAFKQAGVVLEFNPELKSMKLKQGGGVFEFIKE